MRPTVKLSEITTVFADWDWIESKDQSPNGIRLIQTWNVWIWNFKDRWDKARYISEETFDRLNCTEIFPNDCLVSRLPDPVWRSCLIPELPDRLITAVDCTIIRFKDSVIPKYFVYYSQSNQYQRDVDILCTWATRKRISRKALWTIQIPLPPLETQKAIVAKLDQIFDELDQTKSEIQKNSDNTDELWKSALNQAFQGDREMKKIKDIADIKSWKRLPKWNFVQDKKTDYPYIRVSDFWDDWTITVSTVKYITEEIHEQIKKYIITDKDLYVSIAWTIWKTWIIPSELNWANLTENAVRLVYNWKYKIDNRFILYFTNSKSFEVQAWLASRAVAMPKLAISRLENIELPVPPLSEQEKIVKHLDQVSKEVKALKSQYQSQLDYLEELKKSVLDKAFRWELLS